MTVALYSCKILQQPPTAPRNTENTLQNNKLAKDTLPVNCDSVLLLYKDTIQNLRVDIDSYKKSIYNLKKTNDSITTYNKILKDSIGKLNLTVKKTTLSLKPNPKKVNVAPIPKTDKKQVAKTLAIANPYSKKITENGSSYDIITIKYPMQKIGMMLNDDKKNKIRSIENGISKLSNGKQDILFLTNGGMYKADNSPQGLYVENAKELNPIDNNTTGYGNFYLQPNGIFLLTKSNALVIPTNEYNKYKGQAIFATQSGPMLVNNGIINSNFTKGSVNKNIRSGVGIDQNGNAIFVISNIEVNFYDFAELFLKTLNCKNALYLDGTISRMYLPSLQRNQKGGDFGVIIYAVSTK